MYVVDRRVVVDQSTDEAETMIQKFQKALSDSESPLILKTMAHQYEQLSFTRSESLITLSSLRGQRADNREWCLDPSRPAVIVGTVDMIGSRLLFSGYGGVGRNHRSLQAGLLGQDALIVIDEAHLSPSFVSTIRSIKESVYHYHLLRPFDVMLLSATISSDVSRINERDSEIFSFDSTAENEEAKRRLYAEKELYWLSIDLADSATYQNRKPTAKQIRELIAKKIVEQALSYEGEGCSVIVFVSTVELVNEVTAVLANTLGKDSESRILKMTGEMRGAERDELATGEKFKRFLPYRDRQTQFVTYYLIATSCAEVGANLDADHGICDLSSLDSMIQRLGRINRFGKVKAAVTVVINKTNLETTDLNIKKHDMEENQLDKRYKDIQPLSIVQYYTWLTLHKLPKSTHGLDASPAALRGLPKEPRAYHAVPVVPYLDDARLDDWAMTSLQQAEYARPLVAY